MEDKSLLSTVVQIVEKFINNWSLWFWLSTFFAISYVLYYFGEIELNDLISDKRSLLIVAGAFSLCMLMNAISFHYYFSLLLDKILFCIVMAILWPIDKGIVSPIREWRESKRINEYLQKGKNRFAEYMTVDCDERKWLLWFIFEWQPKAELEFPYSYRLERQAYGAAGWSDFMAYFLWSRYILREKYDPYAYRMWNDSRFQSERAEKFGESYELIQSFPLLDFLKTITSENAELRDQIIEARKEISGLSRYEVGQIEKPSYHKFENEKVAAELMEARREFGSPPKNLNNIELLRQLVRLNGCVIMDADAKCWVRDADGKDVPELFDASGQRYTSELLREIFDHCRKAGFIQQDVKVSAEMGLAFRITGDGREFLRKYGSA